MTPLPESTGGFTELDQFEIDPCSVRLLPEGFCRKRGVVVLGGVEDGDGEVTVGMVEPRRQAVVREVAARLERPRSTTSPGRPGSGT